MTAITAAAGREELRRAWQLAWAKARAGQPLSVLEALLADVLRMHPEYHAAIGQEGALARDWLPAGGEPNPFLHMGLHVALREGIAANRPAGLAEIAGTLARARGDAHLAEHQLMDCLAQTLWEAERDRTLPDEAAFLERARRLTGR